LYDQFAILVVKNIEQVESDDRQDDISHKIPDVHGLKDSNVLL